jgi:ribose 5-phosphate isomerase B
VSTRKLAIAADHAGAALKAALLNELQTIAPDWEGIDLGGDGSDLTDDYPDASRAVAELMQRGGAERGLLICGSGIGVTIAANKFNGIRASIAHDPASAEQGVVHDAMNVLSLGAKVIDPTTAATVLAAFLTATPSDAERFAASYDSPSLHASAAPQILQQSAQSSSVRAVKSGRRDLLIRTSHSGVVTLKFR